MTPIGGRPYWRVLEHLKLIHKGIITIQNRPPYLLSPAPFIFSMWGPHGSPLGSAPPMHVGRAWGHVPWVPHVLGILPRSSMGPERIWVSRVTFKSCRLPCSPILTRFRVGIVNLLCAPYGI